jgi:hypothetical protein
MSALPYFLLALPIADLAMSVSERLNPAIERRFKTSHFES